MGLMVFLFGAAGYSTMEYLFRGYTHWSMALTGGACLLAFYYYAKSSRRSSLIVKALAGAGIFTVFEFSVGLVVNIWYHWHVWDYSGQSGNIMGQICPLFSFIWFVLCLSILVVHRNIRNIYHVFHG